MKLYVDETENENIFIVAGILVKNDNDLELAYKKFKKTTSQYPLPSKAKQHIFVEFKSTTIDYRFQKIKSNMLQEIRHLDNTIIYSSFIKKHKSMKQALKESVYMSLLSNIINNIDDPVDIIFDKTSNNRFDDTIASYFIDFDNVCSINPLDSQQSHGLQFADNICSTIRLHLNSQDDYGYYSIIEHLILSV